MTLREANGRVEQRAIDGRVPRQNRPARHVRHGETTIRPDQDLGGCASVRAGEAKGLPAEMGLELAPRPGLKRLAAMRGDQLIPGLALCMSDDDVARTMNLVSR